MSNCEPINTHRNKPPRDDGWYWVRPTIGDEKWVPAHYVAEVMCWYSARFGGLPDRHMLEIGEAIARG